ncbi:MAG: SDR family oxidoreductase [Xanthomonadales bacterium]|nr:SDR family oxidoreductase [Xanthomonadales bacterium]
MSYFVTGGTGFIGRNLIDLLVKRKGTIFVLVRRESQIKFKELVASRWPDHRKRIQAVTGDLEKSFLGVAPKKRRELEGEIQHVFHLAAIYDLQASAQAQESANVEGTRRAVKLAEFIKAKNFHHVSSIAAAGLYPGVFREDMFEEAKGLDHPYFRTKHDAERVVREECSIPWRVYRPGLVIGHSETGQIDKIDGPYYFFKMIQKMRKALPSWMPAIGIEGGRINIVPVDYIAKALDHIAHKPRLNKKTFHLVDPKPLRIGEVLNVFAQAAHAPQMTMRIDARIFEFIPQAVKAGLAMFPPIRRVSTQILKNLGLPRDMMKFVNYPTRFDNRETEAALKGSGIAVPRLREYAWVIWDYWERHLDPDLFIDRSLRGNIKGKNVLITGASSGIGKATAEMMARAGANVILVARGKDKLLETHAGIAEEGGKSCWYTADLADEDSCKKLIKDVLDEYGKVDYLVNNAGHSIRRSISLSYDRIHDYERLMQLNYFGSLKLILGFLPGMEKDKFGHVINISSIGVLTNAPRFSGYVASKAALDAFSRCAAAEYNDTGVKFTTINMPLVRTPMIAPTKMYDNVPTISAEEAADMVKNAVIFQPQRIATRMGIFVQIVHMIAPSVTEVIMNSAFRMFPDSAAAKGKKSGGEEASQEQLAFAMLMKGVHW